MEASQADAGQQAEGQEAQAEAPEQQESGQDQLSQRLDEIAGAIPQMQESIESLQGGDEDDDFSFSEDDSGEQGQPSGYLYDEMGNPVDPQTGQVVDPDEADAKVLQDLIGNEVSQAVQQAVAPLVEQQQEQRIVEAANELETQYPDLKNPELADQVVEQAREAGEEMGHPELAGDPTFVKMAYLAGLAEQVAAGQTPAGSSPEVELEGGGGPAPAPAGEDDLAKRIVEAGRPQGGILGGLA